jgi:hypothetical protein
MASPLRVLAVKTILRLGRAQDWFKKTPFAHERFAKAASSILYVARWQLLRALSHSLGQAEKTAHERDTAALASEADIFPLPEVIPR